MNAEQTLALEEWNAGKNVKVVAVPGAGKSRVLLEACKTHTKGVVIILAYNHDLCEETKLKLAENNLDDRVICLTFHGLATYCIMPAYDDMSLFDAIEGVESGEIEVDKYLHVSAVLIDESQDFRPSFLRLLRLVLKTPSDVQYLNVGDPRQMLYTYDNEDPADLKYLNNPEQYFISSRDWKTIEFFKTHRLTESMAKVVSQIFNVNIVSAKANQTCRPVVLYTTNLWKTGPLIYDIVKKYKKEEICILVPKKKNNGPLKTLVNFLSKCGIYIYLHGFDGQDSRIKKNKLCISTWHASKGTERRIVIVFGINNDVEQNPFFVAVTRAFEQLILVQDEENPNIQLVRNLNKLTQNEIVYCKTTNLIMNSGIKPKEKYVFNISEAQTYSLDSYRPKGTGRWMRNYQHVENLSVGCDNNDDDDVIDNSNFHEDVSDVYALACCMYVEYIKTGKVRLLDDIISPIRLYRKNQDEAIKEGHHSRFITPNIPINTLLGDDMLEILDVYRNRNEITPALWCELAFVAKSWNDYHHSLRQCKPFTWFDVDKFHNGCTFLLHLLKNENAEFDVRITKKSPVFDVIFHARVHILTSSSVYYLVWSTELTHNHRMHASLRAALCTNNTTVMLVNLKNHSMQRLTISQSSEFLQNLH